MSDHSRGVQLAFENGGISHDARSDSNHLPRGYLHPLLVLYRLHPAYDQLPRRKDLRAPRTPSQPTRGTENVGREGVDMTLPLGPMTILGIVFLGVVGLAILGIAGVRLRRLIRRNHVARHIRGRQRGQWNDKWDMDRPQ